MDKHERVAYHWSAFLGHFEHWQQAPSPSGESSRDMAVRVAAMFRAMGYTEDEIRQMAPRFHLALAFIGDNIERLQYIGDGDQAIIKQEVLVAVHQAFQANPPPDPKDVSVDGILEAAEKCCGWIKSHG